MNNYFKIFFKKYLYFFFIFLIFAHYSSFFTNIYKIFKRNYNERLLRTYDYCENYGYGYVNKINSLHLKDTKSVYILNFELLPETYGLFHNLQKDEGKDNLIILNYLKEKHYLIKKLNIDLNNYQLINKDGQCFYYKKIKL